MTTLFSTLAQQGFLSLDSLWGGLLIGPLLTSWRDRANAALLFGACDFAASLLGVSLARTVSPVPDSITHVVMVLFATVVVWRHRRWAILALPFIFSLDNLLSGLPVTDSFPVLGVSSTVLASVGISMSVCAAAVARRLCDTAGGKIE